MSSWDGFSDLTDLMQKEKNFDFILIGIQRSKDNSNSNANVSMNIPNKKSAEICLQVLESVAASLVEIIESPAPKRKKKK